MTVELGGLVTLAIFILGLIYKVAQSHFVIKELDENDDKNKSRINKLETTQLKMIEALDRTYATEKFVYEVFITRREHGDSMERLEEKLVMEMSHMNTTLDKICKIIEGSAFGSHQN
jgi:cell division protein FtsI/penicillin-binding protein 2